jgi:hypothetical protein
MDARVRSSQLGAHGSHLAVVVSNCSGNASVGSSAISSVLQLHIGALGVESGFHAHHQLGDGGLGDDEAPSHGKDRCHTTTWSCRGNPWCGLKDGAVNPIATTAISSRRSRSITDANSQAHSVSSVQ